MPHKIRVACIGAGYFAHFHLEAWKRMEEVELIAVCDLDAEKVRAISDTYGVARVYVDYREMIRSERPDVVDIITPPNTHLDICAFAAAEGIHMICQKPLAPDFKEALELVAEVEKYPVRFMVHENFRFQPWFRAIKHQLNSGQLGDRLHQIHFQFRTGDGWQKDAYLNRQPYFRQMPRLLVFETGVHYIDVFRFLGGEITAVFAHLKRWNSAIAGEDAAYIVFEYEGGALAIWDANRYNESRAEDPRFTFGTCLVEGNKGSLLLETDGSLSLHLLGEEAVKLSYPLEKKNFSGDCVYATQVHFIHALSHDLPFETEGRDYLHTLTILEAVYESAATGQRIEMSGFKGQLM